MTDTVRLSAVIPAHNAEPFLREAIESVLAQQTPIELVVVNDGSTDATDAIIASYGSQVVHISQEQRGLGATRNRGIAASHGEWIAFLDADDLWVLGKSELQLDAIAARPALDLVFGQCVEFSTDAAQWPARTEPFTGIAASGMLARRTLFDTVGSFEETDRVGEFLDWYSRARQAGAQSLVLDQVLFHRRVHGANMTRRLQDQRSQYLDVMRTHLRRRRDVPPREGA